MGHKMERKTLPELLAFMKKSNKFYLENLEDAKSVLVIAQGQISISQNNNNLHSFSTVLQRITWCIGHIFDWCDYLEENNSLLDDIETDTKINSVLFAYEDDFTEYLERLNSLNSELKLIKTELNNLFVDIRSFIHTSKMGSNDVKNLNQVLGIQSLFNLLIRSMKFAEIEIKADEKTLQSFDYSV